MKKEINKKKFILILCLLLCLIGICVLCIFLIDCKTDEETYYEEGKIVVGGEDTGTKDGKLTFYEANDLHISSVTTQEQISTNAYVIEDGLKISASIDLSGVKFGVAGEHEVKYYYGSAQLIKKIFIYDMPQITGTNSISVLYSKASLGIYDEINAKDSFGNNLDLQVIDDDGMFDSDGSWNVGEFDIVLVAIDKAGQAVYFERKVSVLEERNPVVLDKYTFDVNQESFVFSLESLDKSRFVGVSISGKTVSPQYITSTENGISVDKTFFYDNLLNEELVKDLVNGDKYTMSVLTDKGKSKTDFILTDNDTVVFDDTTINDFVKEIYPCYEPIKFAKATLLNPYQNVVPIYTLIKNGERSVADDGSFIFNNDGAWTLEIDLRGTKIVKSLNIYYDLGLENGTIYGKHNAFSNNLPNGYDLVEYAVTDHGDPDTRYLFCSSLNDIENFSNSISELNTSKIYDMVVTATKDGKVFTQTVNFSVVKDGVAVLSNSNYCDMSVNNLEYTYLKYTQSLVGGRRGVYRWGAHKEGDSGDKSKILFGDDTRKEMKKGCYLTFDIYYTSKAVLQLSFGNGYSYFLYNRASYYGSKEDDIKENGASGVHQDSSYYCGNIIKFFDANGNEIVRKNKDDDPLMKYQKQWITVQIMIETDTVSTNAGLQIYTANSALDLQEIYISNIRVSNKAIMEDDTEIDILPNDKVLDFSDIWKKEENE